MINLLFLHVISYLIFQVLVMDTYYLKDIKYEKESILKKLNMLYKVLMFENKDN